MLRLLKCMGYDPNWKRMNSQMPKNAKEVQKYKFLAMNPNPTNQNSITQKWHSPKKKISVI